MKLPPPAPPKRGPRPRGDPDPLVIDAGDEHVLRAFRGARPASFDDTPVRKDVVRELRARVQWYEERPAARAARRQRPRDEGDAA